MKETRNYYASNRHFNYTKNYTDHTTFAGELNPFDFDGHHNLSTMAAKIAADLRFDENCKRNAIARDRQRTKPSSYSRSESEDNGLKEMVI